MMSQPGHFVKMDLHGASEKTIDDVQAHGDFLWVGTRTGGVWVFDKQGNLVRHITDEDGLPSGETACAFILWMTKRRAWLVRSVAT